MTQSLQRINPIHSFFCCGIPYEPNYSSLELTVVKDGLNRGSVQLVHLTEWAPKQTALIHIPQESRCLVGSHHSQGSVHEPHTTPFCELVVRSTTIKLLNVKNYSEITGFGSLTTSRLLFHKHFNPGGDNSLRPRVWRLSNQSCANLSIAPFI